MVRTARELQRAGKGLSSLVVFYRVHAQSRVLEEGLRAASLPYKVVGGVRFYDRAEVKDLLAYLRVIQSPEDDVSVLRIINTPTRGIGKTSIEKLLDTAAASGTGVWEACKTAGGKIGTFVALIESLQARANELGLAALARAVLDETGYAAMLKNENNAEADARIENLAELIGSMEQFIAEAEEPTLSAFLERVTLQTDEQAEKSGETITLMTVHAATGLEFPVVICAGMEEQLFPFRGLEPGAEVSEDVAGGRPREDQLLARAGERDVREAALLLELLGIRTRLEPAEREQLLLHACADHHRELEALGGVHGHQRCLLYTSPSPRDGLLSRMPSSA